MIIVITGPTCLGKSETAVQIAKEFNGEIVNGDAFQAYKEMEIGVAKPEKILLDQVPHHLYSFVLPSDSFSIMEYQINLRKCIEDIQARGKNVVIVGGSGLYIRAALYDYEFQDEKPFDSSKFDSLTNEALFEELTKVDSEEAKKLHSNNRKRVMRALAIYYSQNKKKSEIIKEQLHQPIYKDVEFYVRDMNRDELYDRINQRVDLMIKNGLFNEVKYLLNKYGKNAQCMQAIGYKEMVPAIEGQCSIEEATELIKQHTRNYAKRQLTFIRHQFPVVFYKNTLDLISIIRNKG